MKKKENPKRGEIVRGIYILMREYATEDIKNIQTDTFYFSRHREEYRRDSPNSVDINDFKLNLTPLLVRYYIP